MKPWKSINEQIAILRSRGMTISDDTRAQNALKRFGYYRLSGYWYSFRQKESDGTLSDHFVDNTHLSEIVDLYIFDKRLRLLALDALERIELALQVDVAHSLGATDPVGHTSVVHLNRGVANKSERHDKKTNFEVWSGKYGELKKRAKHRAFVRHNLDEYGELPIWVAIEVFDFGTLSHLFKMMRRIDRDKIAAKYGLPGGHILEQWLKSLTYIRNVSAHHERLWNNNIKDSSAIPPQFSEMAKSNQYRTFRYLCIMQFLLNQICPDSSWKHRTREHLLAFPTPANKGVEVGQLGVVEDWENWALWKA